MSIQTGRGIAFVLLGIFVGVLVGGYVGRIGGKASVTEIPILRSEPPEDLEIPQMVGYAAGLSGKKRSEARPWKNLTNLSDRQLEAWDKGWQLGATEYLMIAEKAREKEKAENQGVVPGPNILQLSVPPLWVYPEQGDRKHAVVRMTHYDRLRGR